MINYLVGGQPLTWWLVINIVGWLLTLLAGQHVIANIRIGTHSLHESCGQLSSLFSERRIAYVDIWNLRYELNAEQCLGCMTDSNIFFVTKI